MVLAAHDDEFARNLPLAQGGMQQVGLALEGPGLAFASDDQEGRCIRRDTCDRRSVGFPLLGGIAAAEAGFVEAQVLAELVSFRVGKVKACAADGDDAFDDVRRKVMRRERLRVERDAGGQLRAGGVPANEDARGITGIILRMRVYPGGGARDVVHLLAPGDGGLEAVIDHRDANAARGIEAADVAIDIRATDAQGFVARNQGPAVDEDQDRPLAPGRKIKVEAVFLSVAIGAVIDIANDLAIAQRHRLVKQGDAGAADGPAGGVNEGRAHHQERVQDFAFRGRLHNRLSHSAAAHMP